jgi:beta-glucosidase
VAAQADVVVLAIGDNEQTSREAWATNHLGDRPSLDLVGEQGELFDAVAATGKPIVVLLFSGRPLSIRRVAERADAILELWYLGQETGSAVANVLFGDVNPGGKLPITIPRSAGHVPAYYNYKPSARRGYLFDSVTPLFPFGFGLSYTTFELANVRLDSDEIKIGETARVRVDVTNTGPRAGDEVVQLYIRDLVSSVTRPVKELKGFQRVSLGAGESATVIFDVTPEHLAFYDLDMAFRVEPGEFRLMVGSRLATRIFLPDRDACVDRGAPESLDPAGGRLPRVCSILFTSVPTVGTVIPTLSPGRRHRSSGARRRCLS